MIWRKGRKHRIRGASDSAAADQRWALGLPHDVGECRRTIRILRVVDPYTGEMVVGAGGHEPACTNRDATVGAIIAGMVGR